MVGHNLDKVKVNKIKPSYEELEKEVESLKERLSYIKLTDKINIGDKIFILDKKENKYLGTFEDEDARAILLGVDDGTDKYYYLIDRVHIRLMKTYYEKEEKNGK
jgi:16S rRNA U1498 N3-methylase RsmE